MTCLERGIESRRLVGDPVMRDNTGNWLVLVQPTDFTAEDFK